MREQNLKISFGVAPVPQLPDSEVVTWGSYWSLGVNQASKEKQAGWQLANFLTRAEQLRKIFQLESAVNDFGRAYPRVDMVSEQTTNPYLAAYLIQAPYAKSWYLNSGTFDQSLNDQLIASLQKNVIKAETSDNGTTALRSFVAEINPILKKYGLVNQDLPKQLP